MKITNQILEKIQRNLNIRDLGSLKMNLKNTKNEINKFLEECITSKPESWFWLHNRWDKKFNLN